MGNWLGRGLGAGAETVGGGVEMVGGGVEMWETVGVGVRVRAMGWQDGAGWAEGGGVMRLETLEGVELLVVVMARLMSAWIVWSESIFQFSPILFQDVG